MIELDTIESRNVSLHETNMGLDDHECFPLKLHALSTPSKGSYFKRKIENTTTILKSKITKALDYPVESFEDYEENTDVVQKAKDFDVMVHALKEKISTVMRAKNSDLDFSSIILE